MKKEYKSAGTAGGLMLGSLLGTAAGMKLDRLNNGAPLYLGLLGGGVGGGLIGNKLGGKYVDKNMNKIEKRIKKKLKERFE